ncbi:BQ2448_4037 [Microbotryum intermedium]|uniref:BQ2448_4037 protein n=1 Tax=Microbotryum intermedium TaxID=269621 RepID=A0A238FFC1_9BASI|nr:BQ2448_4037 [Microbotryum intermedium]
MWLDTETSLRDVLNRIADVSDLSAPISLGLNPSVVILLAEELPAIPQHIVYQVLAAYVYSKASRGNLPGEVLSKVISIQRKLGNHTALSFPSNLPVTRAFEAIKTALLVANRNWIKSGPLAFGPLGQIGTASNDVARWAWTKATDGKIRQFSDGSDTNGYGPGFVEVDAGRVAGPATFRGAWTGISTGPGLNTLEDGPPGYVPPTPEDERPPTTGTGVAGAQPAVVDEVEQARIKLAQMREQRMRLEEEEEERKRMLEIERKEMEQAIANAAHSHVGPTGNGTSSGPSRTTTTA